MHSIGWLGLLTWSIHALPKQHWECRGTAAAAPAAALVHASDSSAAVSGGCLGAVRMELCRCVLFLLGSCKRC